MTLPDPLGLVGVKLGPYVVREQVTEGGVAVIYKGEHEALQSVVAIKVLIPELVEDNVRTTFEQLFLREAQILSQLRSEDILRALDHGRVVCPADGIERPYLVVDWLEGRPLAEDLEQRSALLPRRPFTLPEALAVLEPIARALTVCHASGIVHRDVNPRNVFLEDVPGSPIPRAKLIDFGFAKEVHRTEALKLENVEGTLFARSPDYAAPEHYDREKYGELSETTDTYTIALMLVEMLTLERPLKGVTDTDLYLATTDENDRPTPNRRGAHVSDRVEALFAEALATDQLKRPQMLMDWWERVTAAANASETPVVSVSEEEPEVPTNFGEELTSKRRLPTHKRKSGGAGVFLAVALVLLAAGGGVAWWMLRPLQCPAGFADCNGKRGDGCETALDRDPASCGACGLACANVPGVGCVAGHCHVIACPSPGLKDCNGLETDGCETDVRGDLANCGECGNACVSEGAKSVGCVASKCEITCKPGLADCNGVGKDGCETSLLKDAKNCGRCGATCSASACVEGLCAPLVLVDGVHTRQLAATAGTLYYYNEDAKRIERVSVAEKPAPVATGLTDLTGLAVGGDRLFWATSAGVFARVATDTSAQPDRLWGLHGGATPLVSSQTGFVAWASRAAPPPETAAPRRREKKHAAVMGDKRRVMSVPFAPRGKGPQTTVECNEWPRTFAADDHDTYCCDETTVLAAVTCEGTKCTHRDFDAECPDTLAVDAERLYFSQDVRILSVDRKSNALGVVVKRKRHPRDLVLAGGFLYWLEGEPADVFRLAKDAAAGAAPEALARHQSGVAALTADETVVYWVAAAKGGTIYALPIAEKR
jgi:serine/threonine protein kinase